MTRPLGGSRRPMFFVTALALPTVFGVFVACHRGSNGGGGEPEVSVSDGESLIRAMRARYQGRWYETMTFTQRTTTPGPGGRAPTVQIWYEALQLPGKLRIDIGNPSGGNGFLYRADSSYRITDGKVTRADTGLNPLLVLGFDVYAQPPEQTISVLRHLGYQLSRYRTGSWNGKSVYIVGSTGKTDTTSKQFWIERDRLLIVRGMERGPRGEHIDFRFADYVRAGSGWVARDVWQLTNGEVRVHEEYSGVSTNPVLDSALFDPRKWSTAKHWLK